VRKIYFLILLTIPFLFQSCFELVEQVQLNKDGSGNFQLTLNLSQSKTKLNSIMKLASINGHPVPTKAEINTQLRDIETMLKKTDGISNVKTSIDFENYICVVSYSFLNVTQLNQSVKNIGLKENLKAAELSDNYSYDVSKKIFQRKNKFQLKDIYSKMSNADKEVFSSASYTSIFKFESPVITSSNKDAKVSPSKKAVMLKESALDIITEKKSIENKINITN
jgi:hypothetical protein